MKIRSVAALCSVALLALGASSLTAQEPARIVVEEGVLTLQPGRADRSRPALSMPTGTPSMPRSCTWRGVRAAAWT